MFDIYVKHVLQRGCQACLMTTIGQRLAQRIGELKSRGMNQSRLADLCRVTRQSVSEWVNDKTVLTGPNLVAAAAALETTEQWIATGRGAKERSSGSRDSSARVPLIDFVTAGAWSEAANAYPTGRGSRYLVPSRPAGPNAFGLTIQGRSMEPDFHEGDDIIVDPDIEPRPADYVVAKRERDHEATFKRLHLQSAKLIELRPLNSNYEILQLDRADPGRIIGVMVEHRRYRRR